MAVPVVKKKESEKVEKYQDLTRELKKNQWNKTFGLVYGISTIVGYLMPNPFLYK